MTASSQGQFLPEDVLHGQEHGVVAEGGAEGLMEHMDTKLVVMGGIDG